MNDAITASGGAQDFDYAQQPFVPRDVDVR